MKCFKLIIALLLVPIFLAGCVPLIIAGAGVSAVGVHTAASNLSLSTQVEDMTIKTKAVSIVNKMKGLQFKSNISISVFNRIVLILGEVPSAKYKNTIAHDISYIKGVRVVYNQLSVGQPVSFNRYAHDTWITTEVKARMLNKVNAAHFKVVTNQGIVYLLGLTTPEEGLNAAKVASQVNGVRQVVKAYSFVDSEDHRAQIETQMNSDD